jgi:paired amphipathic helix protein Sin3a
MKKYPLMTKDHEKNSGAQESESGTDQGGSKSGHAKEDAQFRYGEYPSMKNVPRHYFPGLNPPPHSIVGRPGDMIPDPGFHPMNRPQSPPRGIAEDADLSDAMVYLNKIKEEYADDMVTYDNFLETMRDFKFGKVDAEEVCKAVRVLFKNKPHLIETFNEYLPHHLKFYTDRPQEPLIRPFDRQVPPPGPMPGFRRPMYNPGAKLSHPSMTMSMPPPGMHQQMPMPGPPPHMNMGPGMPQSYGHGNPPIPPRGVPSPMRMPPAQMAKQPYFPYYPQQKPEDFEKLKAKQATEFIQKVKRRYAQHPAVYKAFVELLQTHQAKNTPFDKVRAEVNSLLWENPDLCEDFERNFVPVKKQGRLSEKSVLHRIKEVLTEKSLLDDFLKCINYFNQKFINERDLLALVEPALGSKELIKGFKEFINYKEMPKEDAKNIMSLEKDGSYRVLNVPMASDAQDPIAREVLNMTCISCPTFDSEDSNYVFLKRNIHEEALFRVEDERSEADILVERIQYFINALESVLDREGEPELSMRDLGMSPGLIKEVLKGVYEKSASEVLEGILTKPQIAIPIVIKRMYTVCKRLKETLREKRKVWREVVERNYYKALDSVGPTYKNQEKNVFTFKSMSVEAEEGIYCDLSDQGILGDVKELFDVYVRVSQADNKKAAIPNLYRTIDLVFDRINRPEFDFVSDFPLFCVFRFIILAYKRLLEIKEMSLPSIESSRIAVQLHLQGETKVVDRYDAVRETCRDFMKKAIDSYLFEDRIREYTDCKGYKLYNLKKMMSKIEKHIIALLEDKDSLDSLYGHNNFLSPESLYHFNRKGPSLIIKAIKPARDEDWDNYTEKMRDLVACEEIKPGRTFLERRFKKPSILGYLSQNIKMCLRPGSYKMRFISGSECLYVSHEYSARKKSKL